MPRNTTGGKNFKKFKAGGEGYRARASREAADGIVNLIIKKERKPDDLLCDEIEGLKYLLVGRVTRRFGNGRNEVYCHDGNTRQCAIRGLLRKKGQVFIDVDSLVVVSLREALSFSSDDELAQKAVKGDSDIIGLLDDSHIAMLRTTQINKKIFPGANDDEDDDLFDRSEQVNTFINNNEGDGAGKDGGGEDVSIDKL